MAVRLAKVGRFSRRPPPMMRGAWWHVLKNSFSLTDTLGVGFSLHPGVPGGTKDCLLQRQSQPQPPATILGLDPPKYDIPVEDRDTYPSRMCGLEGVRSESSTGVSKSRGYPPPPTWVILVWPGAWGPCRGTRGALPFFMIPGRQGTRGALPFFVIPVPSGTP